MKSDIDDFIMYGIDLKHRRIYFGHPIDHPLDDEVGYADFTQKSIEIAVRAMHQMVNEAQSKPIEIHMNSEGGDPYAMLRLYDEILACPCQVKFFGGGCIMSCATWIMMVCDERNLHPNTTVMMHDGSAGFSGKHTDVQISAAEDKRLQDLLYDIYAANSRMPRAFWEDVCQRDLYLTASEAVSLGLADKLIEPKKRGNLRKARQAALKKAPDTFAMQRIINDVYARINKVKVPKLELNPLVKEPTDCHIIVDDKPIEPETVQPAAPAVVVEPAKI